MEAFPNPQVEDNRRFANQLLAGTLTVTTRRI